MMRIMVVYGLIGVTLWLIVVSFFLYKITAHYSHLVAKTKKRNLGEILEFLIGKEEKLTKEMQIVQKEIHEAQEEGKSHYQKIGFVRFNPFDRVGGEQSFVIAILNRKNSGIVINFLHTREGIRTYARQVTQGGSAEYELSEEEKEAIQKAQ
ncbi:MAG TPA: DUF4446 family protein [Patescibacteria group bacterium]|nr:DUF4446 family protein [Patescibacteria group bacterium]